MSYSNNISNTECNEHKVPITQCGCEQRVFTREVGFKRIPKDDACDPCGANYEKVQTLREIPHVQIQQSCATTPSCIEPPVGVSSPNGLYSHFQFGLGVEHKVKLPGSGQNSGHNLIPWYGIDWSFLDSSLPFSPRIIEDCSGTVRSEKDRTTLQVIGPDGKVIKEFKAPSFGIGGGSISYRLLDQNPLLDEIVTISSGTPTNIEAGEGINVIPRKDGFRIVNTALATPVKINSIVGSGITVTGGNIVTDTDGVAKQTFNIGIDCGSLRNQCGFVKSVNNITPDPNGNINIQTAGGSGLTGATTPDGSVTITYPTATTVGLSVNQDVLAQNFIRKPGNGLLNQVLVSNGDGTYRWADLCALISQLGCSTGGGGGSTTVPQPTNARPTQAVANGGAADGSVAYSCGDPLLVWDLSPTAGITYEVREGTTVIATNLTTNTYQTSNASIGNRSYAVYAKLNGVYSLPASMATAVISCSGGSFVAAVGDNKGDVWKVFSNGTVQRVANYAFGAIQSINKDAIGNLFAANPSTTPIGNVGDGAIASIPNSGTANLNFTTNISPKRLSPVSNGFFYATNAYYPNKITKINALTGQATEISIPNAPAFQDLLNGGDIDLDSAGNAYYLYGTQNISGNIDLNVAKITPSGTVSTLGTAINVLSGNTDNRIIVLSDGTVFINARQTIHKITPSGTVSLVLTIPNNPNNILTLSGMATDGTNLYVNHSGNLYKIDVATNNSTVLVSGQGFNLSKRLGGDGNLYGYQTSFDGTNAGFQVYRISTTTGSFTQVLAAPNNSGGTPFSIIAI